MALRHLQDRHARLYLSLGLASALMISSGGCSHRRSTMRPVYGTPVVSPSAVVPTQPGRVMTTESDPSEPFLTPIPSATLSAPSDSVTRTGVTPPVPRAAEDEPPLLQIVPTTPTSPRAAPDDSGPELTRPNTARPTSARINRDRAGLSANPPATSTSRRVEPFLANPGDLQPTSPGRTWKYIIVHHSASRTGGYQQIDREHRKVLGYEGCGYHFVIGNGTDTPDGQIEASERWIHQKSGVHCRNGKTPDVNQAGIGICLVGNFDQAAPTPRQIAAAARLVAYLEHQYGIDAEHAGTHGDFAASPTACPGENFPREAIFGKGSPTARQGY